MLYAIWHPHYNYTHFLDDDNVDDDSDDNATLNGMTFSEFV